MNRIAGIALVLLSVAACTRSDKGGSTGMSSSDGKGTTAGVIGSSGLGTDSGASIPGPTDSVLPSRNDLDREKRRAE